MGERERNLVNMAAKFYSAQKSMKFLFGDDYPKKVAETRTVIEAVQKAHGCDTLKAVLICVEKPREKFGYHSGMMIAIVLATAVEMIEPDEVIERACPTSRP